uniref:Uncharacterized protein n=1 Tax=Romanomermis culicivorax TaxID=13658 RepID=A0A915L9Y5_ROMCU
MIKYLEKKFRLVKITTVDLHSRLVKDCRSSPIDLPHNNASGLHANNNGVSSDSNSVFNLVMRRTNSRTPSSNGGEGNNISTTTKHDSVSNGDSATVSPPQVTSTSHPHIDSPSTPPASSSGASPLSSGGMSTGAHDPSALHHRTSMMTMSSDDSSSLHRARCSTSPTTSDSGGDVASSRGVRNGGGSAAMSVRRRSRPTSTTTTANNGSTMGTAPLTTSDEARRMSSISPGSVHSGSGMTNTSSGATSDRCSGRSFGKTSLTRSQEINFNNLEMMTRVTIKQSVIMKEKFIEHSQQAFHNFQ